MSSIDFGSQMSKIHVAVDKSENNIVNTIEIKLFSAFMPPP